MRQVVVDASIVAKWFQTDREDDVELARALRTDYQAGELALVAPPLLTLELLNAAARRWGWDEHQIVELAETLVDGGFERVDPDMVTVARWAARGLTAYDAAYVAVAEQTGCKLVTADAEILARAPELAEPLG